jgi:hypothetical protein
MKYWRQTMLETTSDTAAKKAPEPRKRFSTAKRTRATGQGIINLALLIWAVRDIRHRSDDEIKGSRKIWTLAAFAPPIGPIAYLLFGRKRSASA